MSVTSHCYSCGRDIPVRPGSRDGDIFRQCSHVCGEFPALYFNETSRDRHMSNSAHATMVWETDELWDEVFFEPDQPYFNCQVCAAPVTEVLLHAARWMCIKCVEEN